MEIDKIFIYKVWREFYCLSAAQAPSRRCIKAASMSCLGPLWGLL